MSTMPLRTTTTGIAAALALGIALPPAKAADKVTFLTSWYAQAEHGGFYQAKAAGLYEKANLDVTIKMGGPQVNGLQLLLAGEADVMMGYDFQVLTSLSKGIPVLTIATSFQKDLQGLMTHDHVKGLDDLKDNTILVATPGRSSWWPWLRRSTATAMRRPSPIRSTCSRSSTTRTWCSSPIHHRSRSRRCRRACPSSSSCLPTTAIRPTEPPWSRRPNWWRSGRTWRGASCGLRSKAGKAISRAIPPPPTPSSRPTIRR